MNVRTTIVLALVLIVGIGVYYFYGPDTPPPQDKRAEKKKEAEPLYELEQLVKLEIDRPGKPKLVLTKPLKEGKKDEYEDWRLVKPIQAKAANWEINAFADKFKAPKCKESFTPGEGGFPAADKIGLANPKAVIVVIDKTGASRKLDVGDRVFGGTETYIRLAGADKAHVAELDVRDQLKKDAKEFRAKDLFDFDKAKAVQVDIVHEGKTYTLVKGEADKWVIDRPVKTPADKSKVDSLLSDIRYLRAEEFVEDAPKNLRPMGLDKPQTTVSVIIEEKIEKKKDEKEETPTTTQAAEPPKPEIKRTTHTVLVGGASDLKGEKFYCKLGNQPWVVSVTKANYEKIQPKLDTWRDAKVTQAKVLDATKIDLTVAGIRLTLSKKTGVWAMTAPKIGQAEKSAVADLLNALKDLKANSWVDDPKDKKAYGLDKPRAEIVLTIKGQPTAERFLIGGDTKSGLLTHVHQAACPSIAVVKIGDAKKLLAPALSYRDRSVMHFAKARADQIELTRKGKPIVLAKQKGAWKMTKPVSADADTDAVNDLLGDLSSLKARQIAGEGDLAKFGLDKPELKVAVRVKPLPPAKPKPTTTRAATSGPTTAAVAKATTQAAPKPAATKPKPRKPRTYTLLVAKKGDKIYAVRPKSTLVAELDDAVYDNLTDEMHDRKPLKFETSKVTAVDVVGGEKPLKFAKKDDKWSYVPDPHLTIDEKKVTDLLTGLHDLKVERYVAYAAKDLKPFGLDKPELTVTIRQEGAKPIIMLLSKADKDGKRKATIKAEPGKMKVFIVTKSDVEKFAKKVGDFAKS